MHDLAVRLADLTKRPHWEAGRYGAIGLVMEQLAKYCAVCDCQNKTEEKE